MAGITQILQGVNGVPGNRPVEWRKMEVITPRYLYLMPEFLKTGPDDAAIHKEAWYNLPVYFDEPLLVITGIMDTT